MEIKRKATASLTCALTLALAATACESPTDPAEALLLAPSASMAEGSTVPVIAFADGGVVGSSKLVRTDHGVRMTFHASGLEPGTVATIWWVIFNNPDECAGGVSAGVELKCVSGDFPNAAVDASVFYAAGHVIGGSGKANYGASLPVGKLTVDPDPDANQLIVGDGILKNARGADVHLVLRTHGEAIPGLINQQLNTFDAGCTTAPPALQGPNTCMNLLFAPHEP